MASLGSTTAKRNTLAMVDRCDAVNHPVRTDRYPCPEALGHWPALVLYVISYGADDSRRRLGRGALGGGVPCRTIVRLVRNGAVIDDRPSGRRWCRGCAPVDRLGSVAGLWRCRGRRGPHDRIAACRRRWRLRRRRFDDLFLRLHTGIHAGSRVRRAVRHPSRRRRELIKRAWR